MLKFKVIIVVFLAVVLLQNCKESGAKESSKEVKIEQETKEELIKRVFSRSEKLYAGIINIIDQEKPLLQPRSIQNNGGIRLVSNRDWTCGFFSGSLWYLYEYTKDDNWKKEADKFTTALDSVQFNKSTHDLGFMVQNSYGNAYRLTNDPKYSKVIIEGAKSLITRYRPKAKIIQSWSWGADTNGWEIPVIIDNMMNLNLLYKATIYSGDTTFAHIANMHALTTLKNHYRHDNSCFHVIDYDQKTGKIRRKMNFQGYADSSSWARGQAWGLYGFTEVYRDTDNEIFLKQAKNIADYIIDNSKIPNDKIPYWDYDAPEIPYAPRDASSAAITASAMLELAGFLPEKKDILIAYATDIIKELASEEYLAKEGENEGFILKHSVGNIHDGNETNVAIIYADYYFLESLIRWRRLKE